MLDIPPTKSNLLALRRQLRFAEEGYELLDQKRQILIYELMNRLKRVREAERRLTEGLQRAFQALREAALDTGSTALDRATIGSTLDHQVRLAEQRIMGLRISTVSLTLAPAPVGLSLSNTTGHADLARRRFLEALPALAEMAELANAIQRLARELRKTQRRCNALSKILIPSCRETIGFIVGTLDERERESAVILKMVRNRLQEQREASRRTSRHGNAAHGAVMPLGGGRSCADDGDRPDQSR